LVDHKDSDVELLQSRINLGGRTNPTNAARAVHSHLRVLDKPNEMLVEPLLSLAQLSSAVASRVSIYEVCAKELPSFVPPGKVSAE
jgi:hypothetical protein